MRTDPTPPGNGFWEDSMVTVTTLHAFHSYNVLLLLLLLRLLHLLDHAPQLVQASGEDALGLIHNVDGLNPPDDDVNLELGCSRDHERENHTRTWLGLDSGCKGGLRDGVHEGEVLPPQCLAHVSPTTLMG